MRKWSLWLMLGVAAICGEAKAASSVTPLDDLSMINPITGEAVSGGKDWVKSNPAWDGKTIKLAGAKGETLMFQLVFLREAGDTITNIKIEPAIEAAKNVKAMRAWCIWNTPEIAVPFEGNRYTFDIPSTTPLEQEAYAQTNYLSWSAFVEFSIPRDFAGDKLAGTVKVSAQSGLSEVTFPIEVQVYKFELRKRPSHIIEMNSYGDYRKSLPGTPETFIKLSKLMREHRCTFVQVPYSQGGNFSGNWWAPKVDTNTGELDWTEWDKNFGSLFDGTAFDDGEPVSHFLLPLNYTWPLSFGEFNNNRANYDKINIQVRKNIFKHIEEKGWKRTVFLEFHNENPSNGAKLPWHLDEPRSEKDMEGHAIFNGYYAEAAKDAPEGAYFQYRMDISAWQRVKTGVNTLAPNIASWVVSWDPKFFTPEAAEMFHKFSEEKKGIFLRYGEISGFNSSGKITNWSCFDTYLRDCWANKTNGFEQWMIDCWASKNGMGPMQYSQAAGARDLIWPGDHFGIHDALPSFRLKALRESNNLFDYATLAVAAGKTTYDDVLEMVKNMDTNTSAAHYAIKAKLAGLLNN